MVSYSDKRCFYSDKQYELLRHIQRRRTIPEESLELAKLLDRDGDIKIDYNEGGLGASLTYTGKNFLRRDRINRSFILRTLKEILAQI